MTEEKLIKFSKIVFLNLCISVLMYFPMISKGLTNTYDGLWHSTYFQASTWEISLGRWVWPFVDKVRGGYAAEPLNSLLTLFIITVATVIVFSIFGWKRHYSLYVQLMLISTTVSNFLSYRFNAPTFSVGYLLAVLAVWCAIQNFEDKKYRYLSWIGAIGFVCLSLGCYQAFLGLFAILIVFYVIYLLMEGRGTEGRQVFVRSIIFALIACVCYKIIWEIALRLKHISAASYKGADNLSVVDLVINVPNNILRAIFEFGLYFEFHSGEYILGELRPVLCGLLLIAVIVVGIKKLKGNVKDVIFFIFLILLIPVAANIFELLTAGFQGIMLQMTASDAIIIPLMLILLEMEGEKLKKGLVIAAGAILLYGNVFMVGTDIDAMDQGTTAARNLIQSVNNYLIENDMCSSQYEYVFAGKPSDNGLFYKNEVWHKASEYAQYGNIWMSPDCMSQSYNGLMYDSGLNLHIADDKTYDEVLHSKEVLDLPSFPNKDSIIKKGNTIIIKISDYDLEDIE